MIKLSVGVYLTRLINQFWASKAVLSNSAGGRLFKTFLSKYINCMFYASLLLSFVGVLVAEMVECRPFAHYWQVTPDPGASCRQSYGQLFTMGGFNILTDMILIALPLPLIIEAKLSSKVKLESLFLMLFPLVNIIFTAYRLPNTVSPDHRGSQRYRTLMASLDILLSTASANALVVTSFLQGRGFKKTKSYKHPESEEEQQQQQHPQDELDEDGTELRTLGSTAGLRLSTRSSMIRRSQLYRKQWGLDEDDMMHHHDHHNHAPLEESPPASLEFAFTRTSAATTTTTTYHDTSGLPAADDCSERSTSRLSPYAPAQTTISIDKAALSRVEVAVAEADGTDGADGVVTPPRMRRGSAMGIVVETTWRVDVSSPDRPMRGHVDGKGRSMSVE